jgi:hypothetical protein
LGNPELTNKGRVLSLLLTGGLGAAAGMAAGVPSNPHISPGLGPSFEAGAQMPFQMKAQADQLAQQELEQQKSRAQIAAIPGQQVAQRALVQSEIDKNNATSARKDNYTVPGVGLVDSDGKVIVPEPASSDKTLDAQIAKATADAVRAGNDPSKDPAVIQLQDVKTQGAKQPANDPEFRQWQAENPSGKMADWLRLRYPKQQINVGGNDPNGDVALVAHGLVDGTIGVQALGRMAQGAKLAAIAQAKRLDPNFDMTNFPARQKTANDFASGKSADQIQSFNTFLEHASDLSAATNDFRNTASPLINKPMIWLKKNSGDPAVASYLAKTEPVRTEFASFLQNNHALTESDKTEASKVLDDNYSPAQMQVVLKSMAHTAALRLREVNRRYSNTMHSDYPGLLDPDNAQFLSASGAMSALQGKGGTSGNNSGNNSSAQVQVTAPDGSVHTFPNQDGANKFRKLAGIQ